MVHVIAPHLLPDDLGPLLKFGHHPSSLKKANGVVLDKPRKLSYDSPDLFRIIVLLQTVSKVPERIVASRLALEATKLNLLHRNQCDSLPALSSFDTCLALVDTVRTLHTTGLKVSTLFLDIKGGFDNVNAQLLCKSLWKAGVSDYLVSWVQSFLSQLSCSCCLLFHGSPRTFSPVHVGTPHGSLLFILYVLSLHIDLPIGVTLS